MAYESVTVGWYPSPRKPWAVRDASGKLIKSFSTDAGAMAYAQKLVGEPCK